MAFRMCPSNVGKIRSDLTISSAVSQQRTLATSRIDALVSEAEP
jgi:hypothetical protein